MNNKIVAIFFATLAAALYAIAPLIGLSEPFFPLLFLKKHPLGNILSGLQS